MSIISKSAETESRLLVAKEHGDGEMGMRSLLNGPKICFWSVEMFCN